MSKEKKTGFKNRKKRILIIAIALVLVISASAYVFANANANKADSNTAFKTVTAQLGEVSLNVLASGTVAGANSTIVSSDVDALINSTEVSVGDYVSEGDVLFGLDVEYLQDELEEAEDQLESYKDTLNEQVDSNNDLYVVSPIDGVVTEVNVRPGEDASLINQIYGSVVEMAEEAVMEAEINWAGYVELSQGEAVKMGALGYDTMEDAYIYEKVGKDYVIRVNTIAYPEDTYVDVYTDYDVYVGYGELQVPDEYAYDISGSGDVETVYVTEGKWVSRGDKLFKYKNTSLNNQISDQKDSISDQEESIAQIKALIESPYIKSSVSGIVNKSYVDVSDGGALIKEDDSLLEIVDGEGLEVTVAIDELDVVSLEVGMVADVTIDALPDEMFEGELTDISRIGYASGDITYYDAVVKILNPSEKVLVGMSSSAEIKVQSVENVVVVPVSALQYRAGSYYVYVPADSVPEEEVSAGYEMQAISASDGGMPIMSDADREAMREQFQNMTDEEREAMREQMSGGITAESTGGVEVDESEAVLVPVEVGLMDEFYAEIISGISEGQSILIPVIAEDDSADTGMMMPGMMGGMGGERPEGVQRPQ